MLYFTRYGNYISFKQQVTFSIKVMMHSIGHIYNFVLVYHCNYGCILHRFRDTITYFPKFKEVT